MNVETIADITRTVERITKAINDWLQSSYPKALGRGILGDPQWYLILESILGCSHVNPELTSAPKPLG